MRYLVLAALCGLALPAHAASWKIDPASTLTFTGEQAGEPFTGSFTKFTPVVDFDPASPQTGKIAVTVDMSSATIADKDKQESLPTDEWFHTAKYPTATFVSTNIIKTGEGGFSASGKLTIRDVTLDATLPFTLREEAGVTHAEGSVILERQQFGVGQGQWKDDQWIKFPVTVKFHLLARK